MSSAARGSAAAALFLLMIVGIVVTHDGDEMTTTTFGTVPGGQRAMHELLSRLGYDVERSYARIDRVLVDRSVWWIQPHRLCAKLAPDPTTGALDAEVWPLEEWIASGGTAVIALPRASLPCLADLELAGAPAPHRIRDEAEVDADPADDADPAEEAPAETDEEVKTVRLVGPLLRSERRLELADGVETFHEPTDWDVLARADGGAFVVSRPHGEGRIALIADGRFFQNRHLDQADSAPLVLDLVHAFGAPRIDEREHGLRPTPGIARYLGRSTALPVFLGLVLLGGLGAWWGRQLPAFSLEAQDVRAPTLTTFVDSLAALYSQTRDHSLVLARYRELAGSQIRRHLGMSPDMPLSRVVAALGSESGDAARALLEPDSAVPGSISRQDLRRSARALDELVRKATS